MKKSIIILSLILAACGSGGSNEAPGQCDVCPEDTTCTIVKDPYGKTIEVSCEEDDGA